VPAYDRRVQSPAPTATEEERRPAAILAVYSWDMLRALLALLGALAAFGGQATVGTRTVNVTLGEQILAAVSSASFAALLIILATLLTRRHRWVRIAQIGTLATAIAIGAVSLLLAAVLPGQGVQASALTALLVLVVDAAVILAMTGHKVVAWYNLTDTRMPAYITGTIAFWAASSAVLIVLQALR
jgi:phosphatidylglycerophosphate synthase